MRPLVAVMLSVLAVACEPAPGDGVNPEQAQGVEVVEVDELVDGQPVELALTDDVVYVIAPGVPRALVWVGDSDLATIVGDAVPEDQALVIGTDTAMDLYDGTPGAGMLRMPGCWWVYDGSQWVRYCIA